MHLGVDANHLRVLPNGLEQLLEVPLVSATAQHSTAHHIIMYLSNTLLDIQRYSKIFKTFTPKINFILSSHFIEKELSTVC